VKDIKPAMIVSTVFAVLIAGSAYLVGSLSHLYFSAETVPDPDRIIPTMIMGDAGERVLAATGTALGALPEWFTALILVVVLAASMSTLASLVLVSSASLSVDLLGARARGKEADPRGVALLRLCCGVFIMLSVILAIFEVEFIVNLTVISWSSLAAAFLAPYLYGLFWKRANAIGATVAMIVGVATAVTLFVLWGSPGLPVAGVCAMLLPLVVMPVVSWLTPRQPEAEEAFAAVEDTIA
jgi:Na+/proline symporter